MFVYVSLELFQYHHSKYFRVNNFRLRGFFLISEPANAEEEPSPTAGEEELKELTLDEWKALKTPRQKPMYNIRKAGEGEDPSQWKKMYALQKKKDGEEEDDDEEYVCQS